MKVYEIGLKILQFILKYSEGKQNVITYLFLSSKFRGKNVPICH